VEIVALLLEMADTHYDSDSGNDNDKYLINLQMRLKEIASSSNMLINEYLSLLQRKGLIRYDEEHELYIPTDKGMHFLRFYNMLGSLLI
jgi:predicted transcriptional regulator